MAGEPPPDELGAGPGAEPDFWGLLRTLREFSVDFVVIGGFAVIFHGYVRATKDVDIVPDPAPANLTRLWDALVALDARPPEYDDFRPEELAAPFDAAGLIEGGGNWGLYTRLGRLDVMQFVEDGDGELTYAALRADAGDVEIEQVGHTLWFASADHLFGMKEHAGRDEDLRDLAALRAARGEEG
jgi:hypothetical protein